MSALGYQEARSICLRHADRLRWQASLFNKALELAKTMLEVLDDVDEFSQKYQ